MQIGVGFQNIASSIAEQWINTDRIVDKNLLQPKILFNSKYICLKNQKNLEFLACVKTGVTFLLRGELFTGTNSLLN